MNKIFRFLEQWIPIKLSNFIFWIFVGSQSVIELFLHSEMRVGLDKKMYNCVVLLECFDRILWNFQIPNYEQTLLIFPCLNACRRTNGQTEEFKDAKVSNKCLMWRNVCHNGVVSHEQLDRSCLASLIHIFTIIHLTIRIFWSVDPQSSLFHVKSYVNIVM